MDLIPLAAMALRARQQVPRWYSLAPLHNPPGLELIIHFETWQRVLSRCENEINLKTFRVTTKEHDWVSVKFLFPVDWSGAECKSLQRTLAILFQEVDSVKKDSHSEKFQLVAYGILRSINELKGYTLDTYISHEMKGFLKENADEVGKLATEALRNAARRLHFPTKQTYFGAFVEQGGFLYFGVDDGSGSFLGADYRDKQCPDSIVGYAMTSDNIDNPALQLIFLYALAAVAAWGEKQ